MVTTEFKGEGRTRQHTHIQRSHVDAPLAVSDSKAELGALQVAICMASAPAANAATELFV